MQGRSRWLTALALAPFVMFGIGLANSAFHWHSVLPLYAVTAILLMAIAMSVLAIRSSKKL